MSQLKLAEGMAEELAAVINKYHETMPLATAIGVLEIMKAALIQRHVDECEDEE